jgi:hypothetical protein
LGSFVIFRPRVSTLPLAQSGWSPMKVGVSNPCQTRWLSTPRNDSRSPRGACIPKHGRLLKASNPRSRDIEIAWVPAGGGDSAAGMTGRFVYPLIYDTREHLENLKIKISAPVMTINPICEFLPRGVRDFSSTERLERNPARHPRNVRSHHPPPATPLPERQRSALRFASRGRSHQDSTPISN